MFPDVTHFMLGRGALSDPFLARRLCGLPDYDNDTKIKMIHDFHDEIFCAFDESFGSTHKDIDNKPAGICHKMKGFWEYTAVHLKNSEQFLKKIHRSKTVRQYLDVVEQYFQDDAGWQEKGIYYFLRENLDEN
jgi:tRNA-dihydrouridine synthase